jgi:hypothetical protein
MKKKKNQLENEVRINWKRGEENVGGRKWGKEKKNQSENNWKSEKNVGEREKREGKK